MSQKGYNILIVDDSATTRAVVRRAVGLAGIPVGELLEAPDGAAALYVLAERPVDLVLTDLHMPKMGGAELARRMGASEATRSIPLVAITAEPGAQRLEELKRAGMRATVRKPFTPEAIRSVVLEVLGRGAAPAAKEAARA